ERRIEADLLRARRDVLAQRRRVALLDVDLAARLLAGVDAAVPDLALARELRGGEQLAVAQATDRVVPLADALVAQAHADQQQRAAEAGIGGGELELGRRRRRGLRRQRLQLAELFGRERAVVAELRRDRCEQLAASREQALAFLRVAGERLERARLPVDPRRVLLVGGRHRVDRLHDLLPSRLAVVAAQRGARLPRERVVRERDLALRFRAQLGGTQELVEGARLQLDRGLAGDARPRVRRELGRQRLLPAIGEQRRRAFAVGRREPRDRERRQLGVGARRRACLLGEKARRAVDDLAHRGLAVVGQQRGGLPHRARPPGVDARAQLLPDLGLRQLLGVGERLGEERAAVVGFFLREPGGDRRLADVVARELRIGEREACDLAVVVHAKARIFGGERRAVAAFDELEQPVVAQPVLDVGALPALGERSEFGRLNLVDAVGDLPVVDPHRERVALDGGLRLQR